MPSSNKFVEVRKNTVNVLFFFIILLSTASVSLAFSYKNLSESISEPQKAIDGNVSQLSDSGGYADLVEKLLPTVVNIATESSSSEISQTDEMDEIFRYFFGGVPPKGRAPERKRKFQSSGSGFFVKGGFIITNYHVVKNADKISITTHDRREFSAKMFGYDEKTDLAVLKLSTKVSDIKYAELADSSKSRIGDRVLAIGNPFNLGGTVTSGIISAKSRHLGNSAYEDFIQTDAAINRGNSGGPMFNMNGKVIGINAAIYSTSGGNIGIGFAIPTSIAEPVIAKIISGEKIKRGMIGVIVQPVDKNIAEATGLKENKGAFVNSVAKDGAAEKAGIKQGDIIIEFNGKKIQDYNDLPILVSNTKIGSEANIKVFRNGKEVSLKVVIREQPTQNQSDNKSQEGVFEFSKIKFANLSDSLKTELRIGNDISGVVVLENAGDVDKILKFDIITKIQDTEIKDIATLKKVLSGLKKNQKVLVYIQRGVNLVVVGVNFTE